MADIDATAREIRGNGLRAVILAHDARDVGGLGVAVSALDNAIAAAIREAVEAERKACAEIARSVTVFLVDKDPILQETAKNTSDFISAAIEARKE